MASSIVGRRSILVELREQRRADADDDGENQHLTRSR